MSAEAIQNDYSDKITKWEIRDLKKLLVLEEEYEQTHEWREDGRCPTHFTDELTGREIPFKYHKKGKYGGETCLNTKLYKAGTENGGRYYELRAQFAPAVYLVERSQYESVQEAIDAFEGDE